MRVVHLSKFYPPSRGGLEDIVHKLARGAAGAGNDVHVICGVGPDEDPRSRGESLIEGVRVHRLPTPFNIWSQPVIRGYVRAATMPADVVHLHHPHPLADVAAVRSVSAPLVITHHSDVRRQSVLRPLVNLFAEPVRRRAASICVPTRSHISVSRELEGFEDKCEIVPFGVDIGRFNPEPDGAIPTPFQVDEPVGLFVGRLVGYKGLPVLLEAVDDTDLRVVIVGTGPLEDWMKREVAKRDLGKNVLFAGQATEDELPRYYSSAAFFVLPSVTEAEMFGVTLIEAMACGTPVITTDLPTGVSEVNAPGEVGLSVPVGDPVALREAMKRLSSDHELRAKFGRAARKRATDVFSLEAMVSRQLEVYERALS